MTIKLPIQLRLQDTVQLPKVTFDQDARIKIIFFYFHYVTSKNTIYVYPSKFKNYW